MFQINHPRTLNRRFLSIACSAAIVTGLRLELAGGYWNPGAFSLFVNGRRLLYNPELAPMRHGERQELKYPSPTSLQPTSPPVG